MTYLSTFTTPDKTGQVQFWSHSTKLACPEKENILKDCHVHVTSILVGVLIIFSDKSSFVLKKMWKVAWPFSVKRSDDATDQSRLISRHQLATWDVVTEGDRREIPRGSHQGSDRSRVAKHERRRPTSCIRIHVLGGNVHRRRPGSSAYHSKPIRYVIYVR